MPPAESTLARLDRAVARRTQTVRAGGVDWVLECLDDLDRVIDQALASLRPKGDPASGVSEVCPHFGVVWPSALALCDEIVERYAARPPLSVLELGCGLALPSLVARKLGARRVVASDRHPLVPLFLRRNAARNGVEDVAYEEIDWRATNPAETRFDLVVGSDLLYEPWQPGFLAHVLPSLVAPGGEVLIADPGRRHVDAFVALMEASGFDCDLASVRKIEHGKSRAEVLVIEAKRSR